MLSSKQEEKISKYLSYVLRHKPEEIGLVLDSAGWTSIKDLINKTNEHVLTPDIIYQVVKNNAKQRFALSEDKKSIRANQGHTVEVELDLPFVEPPEILYHGTATRFVDSIIEQGLKAMDRHDVHLSFNRSVATKVGERHGKVIVLEVLAKQMYDDGFKFQCSHNNVWLTKEVPIKYVKIPEYELKQKNKM